MMLPYSHFNPVAQSLLVRCSVYHDLRYMKGILDLLATFRLFGSSHRLFIEDYAGLLCRARCYVTLERWCASLARFLFLS